MDSTFSFFFGSVVLIMCIVWQFRKRLGNVIIENQQVSAVLIIGLFWLIILYLFLGAIFPGGDGADY